MFFIVFVVMQLYVFTFYLLTLLCHCKHHIVGIIISEQKVIIASFTYFIFVIKSDYYIKYTVIDYGSFYLSALKIKYLSVLT